MDGKYRWRHWICIHHIKSVNCVRESFFAFVAGKFVRLPGSACRLCILSIHIVSACPYVCSHTCPCAWMSSHVWRTITIYFRRDRRDNGDKYHQDKHKHALIAGLTENPLVSLNYTDTCCWGRPQVHTSELSAYRLAGRQTIEHAYAC